MNKDLRKLDNDIYALKHYLFATRFALASVLSRYTDDQPEEIMEQIERLTEHYLNEIAHIRAEMN